MTAVPALSEIPSLRDEIDRKAFEQLERLAGQLETGRINDAQFDTGVQSVWNCVSGLASEWVIQTISEVKDAKKGEAFQDRRLFLKKTDTGFSLAILARQLGGGEVRLLSVPATKTPGKFDCSDDPNPSACALQQQNKLTQALLTKGYRQL